MKSQPMKGLRYRRRAANRTQAEMGALIGRQPDHYCRMEAGRTAMSVIDAKILAEALECSIDELL